MYSEELEKEIFDRLDRKRDLIHKNLRTRFEDERQKATMQFNKDLEEGGISIFPIDNEDSIEEFTLRIIDFIEKQTGFKIECAFVSDLSHNGFYVRVNRK
jgi:hypothetical protein